MRSYECTIIVSPGLGEEALRSAEKKYAEIITSGGGEITKMEEWGKRRLAYEINHHEEGYYLFYKFRCENPTLEELSRRLRLDESVLRHLIVKDPIATGGEPKIDPDSVTSSRRGIEDEES